MKRWIIFIAILAIAGIGGAGYLGFRSRQPPPDTTVQAPPTTPVTVCTVEQTVDAPGSVINTNETQIIMPTTGTLSQILVKPGDSVKTGQVLASLADVQKYQAAVAADQLALLQDQQARSALDQNAPADAAQALVALQNAQTGLQTAQNNRASLNYPRANANTLEKLQAELTLAQNALKNAQDYFDKLAGLDPTDSRRASAQLALDNARQDEINAQTTLDWYLGTPSPSDIAAADAQVALAQANLAQAQAAYDKIKGGPDSLDVALADAKVNDDQATLAADQEILANVEIKAPFDGVILAVSASVGATIAEGTALFTLNDPQAVEVASTITEDDYPYINVGQPVSLFFDALPDDTVTGTVSRIVPLSTGGSSPLYDVYLSLDSVPARLVEGMSADGTISIAQRKDVLCLPRAVVQASANGTAVLEVWTGSQEEQRTVQVGLRGDTTVEILSGLKAGDLVVTQ
jgi:RND family efflux transporter MFP subunit